MSGEIYNLNWKFSVQATSFSDVILINDDLKPFLAHRYVLSVHNQYFKDNLLNNPHPHPPIYLRGIYYDDLYSILQIKKLGDNIRLLISHNQTIKIMLFVKTSLKTT